MLYDATLTRRMLDSAPYLCLQSDHDLCDLVARLLSALGESRLAATQGNVCRFQTSTAAAVESVTKSSTMQTSLAPTLSAAIVLDRRGRRYVSQDDILYRLRFWTEDEWLALPTDARPFVSTYDPELSCWAGLEPAPHLTN